MGPRSPIPRAIHQAAALLKAASLAQGWTGRAQARDGAGSAANPTRSALHARSWLHREGRCHRTRTPSAKGPPLWLAEVRPCGFNSDHALIPSMPISRSDMPSRPL